MTESIVFEKVRIFDGMYMLPENIVIVEEGTIAAVGGDLPRPSDALVIDGTGLTMLPGLIDAHTHTFGVSGLQQALIFGVTTELDMFTDWRLAKQIKELQAREVRGELADLRSAGTAATAPEEAQAFVEARLAEGSDYLKIMYDDGKAVGRPMPMISREAMAALVEAAHWREKLAVAHIMTLQQAREVLEAGIDGLRELLVKQQEINRQLDLDKGDTQVVANDNMQQDDQATDTFVDRLAAERKKKALLEPAA